MKNFDVIKWAVDVGAPVVTGVIGWFVGRGKRKNDFLGELQKSIDILSSKNTALLDQLMKMEDLVVKVSKENAELKSSVDALTTENRALKEDIKALRQENAGLSEEVNLLRQKLDGVKTITRVRKDEGK